MPRAGSAPDRRAIEVIEVPVHHDLVAGRAALLTDDLGPGQEEVPNAEPALTVRFGHGSLRGLPVLPPSAQRVDVVHARVVDALHLPPGLLHDLEHGG